MSKALPNLADLPSDVQVFISVHTTELAVKDADMLGLNLTHRAEQTRFKSEMALAQAALVAERTAHSQAIQNRDTIIADLRLQLDGHKKHRFGSRSESLDQLALELVLEEHEIAQAAETTDENAVPASEKDHPVKRINELLPWDYLDMIEAQEVEAKATQNIHCRPTTGPCVVKSTASSPSDQS